MTWNNWHIDPGMTATFSAEDFERWWLHGMGLDDRFTDDRHEELFEHCVYLARTECREITQTPEELRKAISDWADEWNTRIEDEATAD